MSLFENIIQDMLIAITQAQHAANNYSAELAKEYNRKPGTFLQYFPIPNAAIERFKFSIKYAVEDQENTIERNSQESGMTKGMNMQLMAILGEYINPDKQKEAEGKVGLLFNKWRDAEKSDVQINKFQPILDTEKLKSVPTELINKIDLEVVLRNYKTVGEADENNDPERQKNYLISM